MSSFMYCTHSSTQSKDQWIRQYQTKFRVLHAYLQFLGHVHHWRLERLTRKRSEFAESRLILVEPDLPLQLEVARVHQYHRSTWLGMCAKACLMKSESEPAYSIQYGNNTAAHTFCLRRSLMTPSVIFSIQVLIASADERGSTSELKRVLQDSMYVGDTPPSIHSEFLTIALISSVLLLLM